MNPNLIKLLDLTNLPEIQGQMSQECNQENLDLGKATGQKTLIFKEFQEKKRGVRSLQVKRDLKGIRTNCNVWTLF